ncbi:hypothetical protein ACH4OW_11525 [Streptomyces sp. NPDC017056]|uniref:hypothetical protein n=1 Tax=Streptomyces sp. NPDC017056 TaxID=3364973 RepID=UPI0037BCE506
MPEKRVVSTILRPLTRRGRHRRPGRRKGRWHRRLMAYRDVELVHSPAPSPAGAECLLLVHIRRVVGQVTYQVCGRCECGVILQAEVCGPLHGSGLRTRALSHLRSSYPDLAWRSALPRRQARDLTHRLSIPDATRRTPCPHLDTTSAAS